jgi:hypothetical protein
LAERVGSYERAAELVAPEAPYVAHNLRPVCAGLLARRLLLASLLRLHRTSQEPEMMRLRLRGEMARIAKCDCSATDLPQLFLTPKEGVALIGMLLAMDLDVPPGLERGGLMSVFWKDFHTPSALLFCPSGRRVFNLSYINPCRVSWHGLGLMRDEESFAVYYDVIDVTRCWDFYRFNKHNAFPTSVLCRPEHKERSYVPKAMTFHLPDRDLHKAITRWSFIEGWERSKFIEQRNPSAEVTNHTALSVLQELPRRVQPEYFVSTLKSLHLGEELRNKLAEHLMLVYSGAELRELLEILTCVLLDQQDGWDLLASSAGYILRPNERASSKATETAATNFTLRLLDVTGFALHQDVEYRVCAQIGTSSIETIIPGKTLDNPSALIGAIQNTQVTKYRQDASAFAQINDVKAFRRFIPLIRRQATDIPRFIGHRTLGWTKKQDTFVTPFSAVSATDIYPARFRPAHDSDFVCFESGDRGETVLQTINDPITAEWISAIIGQQVRAFHGLPYRPVRALNSDRNREVLGRMLAQLGQVTPLRLSSFNPKHLETIRGYPAVISNLTETQAETSLLSGVWLSEKGAQASLSMDLAEIAGLTLLELLEMTARSLLAGESAGFKERRSVKLTNSQALEGCAVIRQYLPDWPEAGVAWSAIDRVLEEGLSRFTQQVSVRKTDDCVVVQPGAWDGLADSTDLMIELGLLCRSVREVGGNIEVDRNSFFPLLEEFYGEVPRLELVG